MMKRKEDSLLFLILCVEQALHAVAQIPDYSLPPLAKFNPYGAARSPFHSRSSVNLLPMFPFIHQFSNGYEEGRGGSQFLKANLNIPIPKWKAVWDVKGYLTSGKTASWLSYGHQIHPLNMLQLKPSEILRTLSDPLFHEARFANKKAPQSVGTLPSNWNPLHCHPPMCNPFVSSVNIGYQSQKAVNHLVDGLLDFPIGTGPYGEGMRFPLSGTGFFGEFPSLFIYGQNMNAVDPLPKLSRP